MSHTNSLISTPFAIVADEVVKQMTDSKKTKQLTELVKEYGPDSEAIKPLAALKAAKDDEARDELKRILDESAQKQLPLLPIDKDHAAMLAAMHGITNREVGDWRRRRILEMATSGPVTDQQIEKAVFSTGTALDTMTAKLVKDGDLVRDGQGYRAPEPAKTA